MNELKCKQMQLFVNKNIYKYKYIMTVANMFVTYRFMLKIQAI